VLADEAVLLHDVPRNTITVTGSPTFDFWFSMSPSTNYTDFANHVGFDSSKTFVLYLCSSHFIAEKEHLFVTEFVRAMKQNARTKNVSIVIRPHPLNDSIWKGFNIENTVIWPKVGQWVDIPEAKQLYYDTIYHSQAVVGVNTSAFLEAAILDKPCITVLSEQSKAKQTELGHFQHLINGEFLEITTSYQEAASILGSILTGGDVKQAQREKFVEDFIRPCGLNTPASQIMATAIESIGVRTDTD
jgi:hypothetical protein